LFLLAGAYSNRQLGDKAENIERAISAGEEALQSFTREADEREWSLLRAVLADAYLYRARGDRADSLEKAIGAYGAALTVVTKDSQPQLWAGLQNNLGVAHLERIRGDRADNLETAIAVYNAALTIRTREASPVEWAQTQHNLAIAYGKRIRGDRAENQEKAIAAYEAVLTIVTKERQPHDWAMAQGNLGNIYLERVRGDPAANAEKAIGTYEAALGVLTREAFPLDWAKTQVNVGHAYGVRGRGDRGDNLEKAIAANEGALAILTRETQPGEWARAQHALGRRYLERIRGESSDNHEKAIAAYEAALTVRTREAMPHDWAETQTGLGSAYLRRIRGEHADNLERAIAAYDAALTVRTREALPRDWAETQHNLGFAYTERLRGERADNFEKAIAAYEAALVVRTREDLPYDWALTQNNLGIAYQNRVRGDPADNVEKAIAAYEAALTVHTREALPHMWGEAQHNLALAYEKRISGEKSANLKKAIDAAEAALTVRTRAPRANFVTARLLGQLLLEAGDWNRAGRAYANARDALLLLFGQGLNDAEARQLVADTGYMFAQAAFAAAQRGEGRAALALASEGRARLMAAAMKLQTLDLPPEKRLHLNRLRAELRTADRAVEASEGTDRAAAVEKLALLREELLQLVKGGAARRRPASVLAPARAIIADGGALVAPILTHVGVKMLIVTSSLKPPAAGAPSDADAETSTLSPSPPPEPARPIVSIVDMPELTLTKLVDAVYRPYGPDGKMNWRLAYHINTLQGAEQDRLWPHWLAALDDLGPTLWRLLGARIDAALKERGVKRGARLVWLPAGLLGVLPLGLAQDPVSKRRLVDSYEIVYTPSLEALAASQKQLAKTVPATLAAIVNPTGDLPATAQEGRLVASYFPAKGRIVLEGSDAKPEAVLGALKGKSYWHFASHGTFSWDDPQQSAVLMHGKIPLSVGKLQEADGLGRPRLVVLSACETGLSGVDHNPDEFIGLPSAFTALGAAGVLGTLWPVADTATALLIAKFYDLHMDAKLAPPKALRRAQLWLRQATNADLLAYAKAAAEKGRLDQRHAAGIEQELSAEVLRRSRNAALVEWVAAEPARAGDSPDAPATDKVRASRRTMRLARPYAHPYYWAGFIYTGL
jgi:CHAT domain-containing protein